MKAWIAADPDGVSMLYLSKPVWSEYNNWWDGLGWVFCPEELLAQFPVDPGDIRPIELTAASYEITDPAMGKVEFKWKDE